MWVAATWLTCGFVAGALVQNALLNSVRDWFGECLDARSTLFLAGCEVVVLGLNDAVNRLVGLDPSSSALRLFFGIGLYGDMSQIDVC